MGRAQEIGIQRRQRNQEINQYQNWICPAGHSITNAYADSNLS